MRSISDSIKARLGVDDAALSKERVH